MGEVSVLIVKHLHCVQSNLQCDDVSYYNICGLQRDVLLFKRVVGLSSIVYALLLSIRMQKSVGSFVKLPWRGDTNSLFSSCH